MHLLQNMVMHQQPVAELTVSRKIKVVSITVKKIALHFTGTYCKNIYCIGNLQYFQLLEFQKLSEHLRF